MQVCAPTRRIACSSIHDKLQMWACTRWQTLTGRHVGECRLRAKLLGIGVVGAGGMFCLFRCLFGWGSCAPGGGNALDPASPASCCCKLCDPHCTLAASGAARVPPTDPGCCRYSAERLPQRRCLPGRYVYQCLTRCYAVLHYAPLPLRCCVATCLWPLRVSALDAVLCSAALRATPAAVLRRHLPLAAAGHKVLCHCLAGNSRSAATVMAYMMWRHQLGLRAVLAKLKAARPTVNPNAGFRLQVCVPGECGGRCLGGPGVGVRMCQGLGGRGG